MNRLIYFLLFLLVFQFRSTYSQESVTNYDYPFQVIYAENASGTTSGKLDSLNFLSRDEAVKVKAGGLLSIIHYTGIPFEFNTDTIISIKTLSDLVVPKEKKRRANRLYRPSLKLLFSSDPKKYKYNLLSSKGTCFDCNLDLAVINPPFSIRKAIPFDEELYMEWIDTDAEKYYVQLLDQDLKEIKKFKVQENSILIREMPKLTNGNDDLYYLTITDSIKASAIIPIKKSALKYDYPFSHSMHATAALILALEAETFYVNISNHALEYYQRATALSDHPFFDRMLQNYLKRASSTK